jgi:hypothetical protein
MLSEMTAQERKQYMNEKSVGKWAWTLFLLKIANGNPLKILEAAKLNIITALNLLSMLQELKIDTTK